MTSDFEAPLPDVLDRTTRALQAINQILAGTLGREQRPADADEAPAGPVQRTREEAAQE